jgi:isoquinoline 1-oxidoreductase alpha subunit
MTSLVVNGREVRMLADPDTPLLWALRDELGLTGTKYGCGKAQCGACAVLVDGQPVLACITSIDSIRGQRVTTIEGLDGREAAALKAAWQRLEVAQCGYCQSGQIVTAAALLVANPRPTDKDIADAMSGNICRCGTYQRIKAAIKAAAQSL